MTKALVRSITYHPAPVQESPVFSIIVPSWNNLDMLRLCVAALRKHSVHKQQLILHINEGTDGSLAWAREQGISFTHSTENVGVCYALNAAVSLARAEYIVYMNDDMYACPGWDEQLYREIQSIGHPYFFLSGTMIEPAGKNPASITPHAFGHGPADFREQDLLQQFSSFEKADWSGASWPPNVVHRKLWDLVGGYSTEFSPGFYSDPDFCMKLWQAGVRIFKGISASRVYHFQSRSTKRVQANNGRQMFAAKWGMPSSYFMKHYLRMGQPYTGPLPEAEPGAEARLKAWWQRLKR